MHLGPVKLAEGVRPRHVLSYLWASFVSVGLFSYLIAMQPYILTVNLHIPPERRGVVSGDLMFWQEVVAIPCIAFISAWSDLAGRRIICVLAFLVMGCAYAAYPFAGSYDELFVCRMVFALSLAPLAGMLQVIVADYPVNKDRGKLVGLAVFLSSLGSLLFLGVLNRLPSIFQGAGLSDLGAGRASYLSIAGICALSAVVMLALRAGRPEKMHAPTSVWRLVAAGVAAGRQPRIALAYAASFMGRADIAIPALFLALWAQTSAQAQGFTAAEAAKQQGLLFAVVQGCGLLWAPVFGWFADRVNRVTVVIWAIILSVIGYGWMGLIDNPLHRSALPAAVMLGIAQSSGALGPQVLVGQEAPGSHRGAIVGMVVFYGAIGILAISRIGGYAYDHWMPGAPFVIMAAANLALLLFAVYVRIRAPGPVLDRQRTGRMPAAHRSRHLPYHSPRI